MLSWLLARNFILSHCWFSSYKRAPLTFLLMGMPVTSSYHFCMINKSKLPIQVEGAILFFWGNKRNSFQTHHGFWRIRRRVNIFCTFCIYRKKCAVLCEKSVTKRLIDTWFHCRKWNKCCCLQSLQKSCWKRISLPKVVKVIYRLIPNEENRTVFSCRHR